MSSEWKESGERNLKAFARNLIVDFLPMQSFSEDPLIFTEGDGIYVTTIDGRRFVDGLSGAFAVNLGYGNQRLAEAAAEQALRLPLAFPTLATSDRALELTELMLSIMPKQYNTVKFLSGGSEATEAAIRMARQYHKQAGSPGKYKIISHYKGYHGATGNALAAGGWPSWRAPYEPLPGGFIHVHAPDTYHPPFPGDQETLGATYVRLVEEVVALEGPQTIAALITEPIMMSAGVIVPPRDYLPKLRELCDKYNILFILDEVITGFGRSGKLFAAEHWGVWPDIFCFGKGMTGAYAALSSLVIVDRIGNAFFGPDSANVHFQAGHTFGGNPIAAAVAKTAIRQILDEGIIENSRVRGEQIKRRLREMQERYPVIGDIRGEGLIVGAEFVRNPKTRESFPDEVRFGIRLREAARRRNLLVRASHWMIAFGPPLIATESEIDMILDLFEESLVETLASLGPQHAPAFRAQPIRAYRKRASP
jgi:adenosylmethionine-8-amino-7-oxononanoate aminotransferase